MIDAIQVVTTTTTRDEADRLALSLVRQRLAACVQVLGPIESTYHWESNVESQEEWLCLIKSRQSHFAALEKAILAVHSYHVPEILAFPAVLGSQGYLDWLQ